MRENKTLKIEKKTSFHFHTQYISVKIAHTKKHNATQFPAPSRENRFLEDPRRIQKIKLTHTHGMAYDNESYMYISHLKGVEMRDF